MSATAPALLMLNTNKNLEKGLTAEERVAAERQALRRKIQQAARNNNVAGGRRGRTQRKKRAMRLASRKH